MLLRLFSRSFCRSSSFIFLSVFLVGCATSPTGRKQLLILPDSQLNSMGAQAFDEMKAKQPRETRADVKGYVECVAFAVAHEAKDETGVGQWEVVVFRDETANAFALPGGKIGVHTGLLKIAQTPDQLAAVLGHEVGHVIARHGNERVSQGLVTQGGLAALSGALKDEKKKWVIFAALGAQFGVLLPHSRAHESEADQIGLELMAKAGFNPQESVELWKNMGKASGGQPPEFMSTHPSHSTRIEKLTAGMPQALQLYQRAKSNNKAPNCIRPRV